LYAVENVDLDYVLRQFNIQVPANFTYTVITAATPAPGNEP
jgi:hypothetical protein